MLANVTDTYKPLIAQLRENWTSTNTDLSKACLSIARYDFAIQNLADAVNVNNGKVLYTTGVKNPNRAPKGTCDFEECVRLGPTTHYKEKCWRKYPHLKPKFPLNKMRTKGIASNSEYTPNASNTGQQAATMAPPDITS